MNRNEYTGQVVSVMRHVTAAEIAAIREELEGHIEDRAATLVESGCPAGEAERRAIDAMGDAEEVGRALQKQYALGWLIVNRILTALITVLVCVMLLNITIPVYCVWENLGARLAPEHQVYALREQKRPYTPLEIKEKIGSDILYIFGAGPDEDGNMKIYYTCYDQSIFGRVSGWGVSFEGPNGEESPIRGGHSESGGVRYASVEVEALRGAEYVLAVVERYGERMEIPVYVDWEVGT